MNLFGNTMDQIDQITKNKHGIRQFDRYSGDLNDLVKGVQLQGFQEQKSEKVKALRSRDGKDEKVKVDFDYDQMCRLFGRSQWSISQPVIGSHPDFKNLGHEQYLNHYCVTMFADIKGSTRLNEKYTLFQIRQIKDTILTLAIHVANFFGGHIHRLQGDGISIQFVRNSQHPSDAIINALNASALLSQFVKSELKEIFERDDIKPIAIRIGLDYGADEDVLWSYYGVPNCEELTTTSFFTDVAAKLQAKGKSNQIMIGNNLREVLDLDGDIINKRTGDEYVVKTYGMYEFNWQKYLKQFHFFRNKSGSDHLEFFSPEKYISCYISDDFSPEEEYFPGSFAMPKGKKIRYVIISESTQAEYDLNRHESTQWEVFNTGKEASSKKQLRHNLNGEFNGKNHAVTTSAYLGQHHIKCKLKRNYDRDEVLTFPIFVSNKANKIKV